MAPGAHSWASRAHSRALRGPFMGLGGSFMCPPEPIHVPRGAHSCASGGPFICPPGPIYVPSRAQSSALRGTFMYPRGHFQVPCGVLLCTLRGYFYVPWGYFYVSQGVFLSALRGTFMYPKGISSRVLLSGGGRLDDVPSARPFEIRFMNVAAPMNAKIAKRVVASSRRPRRRPLQGRNQFGLSIGDVGFLWRPPSRPLYLAVIWFPRAEPGARLRGAPSRAGPRYVQRPLDLLADDN